MKNPIILMSVVLAVGLVAAIAAVLMMEENPKTTTSRNQTRSMTPPGSAPTGEQLNASHILIMHAGSKNAPSDLNRTREEAKELADNVCTMARKDKTKFASLASTYSECPSSQRGGDLGNFDSNRMAVGFSAATKDLKVGEISGVVETEFGYHVILRKALK